MLAGGARQARGPALGHRPPAVGAAFLQISDLGTDLGLIGDLMAIPAAAGATVLLPERFQARNAADSDSAS